METEINPQSTIRNPQSGVDVAAIERELTALWKSLGEGEEHGGVIRSCVLNLLVYVPSSAASGEIDEILTEVTAAHPSRAILVTADRRAEQPSMGAWVTSRCTLPTATSKQVCCEQITVAASGDQVNELPSAVAPLLLSDLPVYLWWRAVPPLADKVFNRLADLSDRLIIDSAAFADPHGDLVSLALLLRDRSRGAAISDLNWARLTPWRALLAAFYDVADYRPFLDRLERVVIEYVPASDQAEAISPRALLLAGWLASRLKWQLQPAATERRDEAAVFKLDANGREVAIECVSKRSPEVEPGHIAQATLTANAPAAASFNVKRSSSGRRLETEVLLGEERRLGRVLGYENLSESALLGRELEILGHDRVFEQAVLTAGEFILSLVQT